MERYPPVPPLCQVSVGSELLEVIQASPIRPSSASTTGSSAARPGARLSTTARAYFIMSSAVV